METVDDYALYIGLPEGFERWLQEPLLVSDVTEQTIFTGKKFRKIQRPSDHALGLAQTLRIVSRDLSKRSPESPRISYGYIAGRSAFHNAAVHINSSVILMLDVANFFSSIPSSMIRCGLETLGLGNQINDGLLNLATPFGSLPTGFSTSPVLSNLSCTELDVSLQAYCDDKGFRLSRYADDIAISSAADATNWVSDEDLWNLKRIVHQHGLTLADRKTRFLRKGRSQIVTGYSVAGSTAPRIPRAAKRDLINLVHIISKFGLDAAAKHLGKSNLELLQSIEGKLSYFALAEPGLTNRLRVSLTDLGYESRRYS